MECLRRKLPEIVLIDVDMPGGPELLRQVRTHPKGREITIVLHTSSPYDDRRAADMGADATLLKGMYDLPMLVQRLRAYELLRGSAA
jgi:CheY-like chemotaxis protein